MKVLLVLSIVLLACVAVAPTASAGHQCTESNPGEPNSSYAGDCVGFRYDMGCGTYCEGEVYLSLH